MSDTVQLPCSSGAATVQLACSPPPCLAIGELHACTRAARSPHSLGSCWDGGMALVAGNHAMIFARSWVRTEPFPSGSGDISLNSNIKMGLGTDVGTNPRLGEGQCIEQEGLSEGGPPVSMYAAHRAGTVTRGDPCSSAARAREAAAGDVTDPSDLPMRAGKKTGRGGPVGQEQNALRIIDLIDQACANFRRRSFSNSPSSNAQHC